MPEPDAGLTRTSGSARGARQQWLAPTRQHRRRLYEQAPRCLAASRRGAYERRWLAWSRAGLGVEEYLLVSG
jgi:hypothetical protein